MGLDMYLERESYVKNWDHTADDRKHTITVLRGGVPRADIDPRRINTITEQVAYWRKANQIHKWFVDNCQSGVDDCRDYCVSREQLQELHDLCVKVLSVAKTEPGEVSVGTSYSGGVVKEMTEPGLVITNQAEVAELLPCQEGFFFGGTGYDGFYLQDLKDTIEQLKPILAIENDEADYKYHSSW